MKNMLDNGKMTMQKDMVSIIGLKIKLNIKYLKISTKEAGRREKEKALAHFSFQMVADFKDIFMTT
jgi:hypothetical protein